MFSRREQKSYGFRKAKIKHEIKKVVMVVVDHSLQNPFISIIVKKVTLLKCTLHTTFVTDLVIWNQNA